MLLVIKGCQEGLSVLENHETEASGLSGLEILDDVSFRHSTEFLKILEEHVIRKVPRQSTDKQLSFSLFLILQFGLGFVESEFAVYSDTTNPVVVVEHLFHLLFVLEGHKPESAWSV